MKKFKININPGLKDEHYEVLKHMGSEDKDGVKAHLIIVVNELEDDNFKSFNIKEIYGIHNWPGLKLGKIGISTGVIMGGDDNYIIKITGKGGHGALPENTINPIFYIDVVIFEKLEKLFGGFYVSRNDYKL